MRFVVRVADDGFALAACGPFVIVVWRGVPTRPRLEAGVALIEEHAAAIGAPIGVIGIVEERSPPPGPEDMFFLEARFPTLAGAIAAMAGAFETTGEAVAARASGEMVAGAKIRACITAPPATRRAAARR